MAGPIATKPKINPVPAGMSDKWGPPDGMGLYTPPKAKPPPKVTPPPSGGGTTTPPTAPPPDAYYDLQQLFDSYGLGSLAPEILKLLQQGYSETAVSSMLQETDAYKQRFAGNTVRQQNGLAVLDPADYLSAEAGYRQVLQQYGLPTGFYDQPSDFNNWIGSDVSVSEIQERAKDASTAVNNSDPAYLQALGQLGLNTGDLTAAMLDTSRALPILEQTISAAQIGQAALDNGLNFNNSQALKLADAGVTQQQAQAGYQQIGQFLPTAEQLGSIYGVNYGQQQMENDLLGQNGLASQQRAQLKNDETNQFAGTVGAGGKSVGDYKSQAEF